LVVADGGEGGGKKSICGSRRRRRSPQLPAATYLAGAFVARDPPVPRTRAPPPAVVLGEKAFRANRSAVQVGVATAGARPMFDPSPVAVSLSGRGAPRVPD